MDVAAMIGAGADDVIPPQIAPLLKALLEGRVKQMVVIAEMDDGAIMDAFPIIDDKANRFAMLGAIETVKRDYMRCELQSRVEYVQHTED